MTEQYASAPALEVGQPFNPFGLFTGIFVPDALGGEVSEVLPVLGGPEPGSHVARSADESGGRDLSIEEQRYAGRRGQEREPGALPGAAFQKPPASECQRLRIRRAGARRNWAHGAQPKSSGASDR